ncbi:MAG: hypothetical protein ACI31M_04075 [Bacilli bacterium]
MNREELVTAINELVEMSGSKGNEEAKKIQLTEVVGKIADIKNQIAELDAISGQYYNEEDRLRDRQFEVQFQKEIRKIRAQLDHKQEDLNLAKTEEASLNNQISSISTSLSSELIAEATKKSSEATEPKIKEHYDNIIIREQNSIIKRQEDLKVLEVKYQTIQDKIIGLCAEISDLNNTLNINEQNLKVIRENLENNENYVDINRRQADITRRSNLEQQLTDLEKQQSEIISDPVVLGGQAKTALLDGDNLTALNKVREIARQVSEMPYMNENSDEVLAKAEVDATKARDEFFTENKGKKYKLSLAVIDERISFLKDCISKWKEEIVKYKTEITSIDKGEKYSVTSKIEGIQEEIANLEANIIDYKENIKSYDDKDIKKVELQAALNRKEEQLEVYKVLLDAYKATELSSLMEINQFDQMISQLESKIVAANSEITSLENEKLKTDSKSIDVLAKEADIAKLRKLTETVMDIKHSRKFTKTPEEILNSIEQELGFNVTIETAEEVKEEPILSEDAIASLSVDNIEEIKEISENVEYKPAFEDESIGSLEESFEAVNNTLVNEENNVADLLANTEIELTNIEPEQEPVENTELVVEENQKETTEEQELVSQEEMTTEDKSQLIDDTISAISAQLEAPSPVPSEMVLEPEVNEEALANTESTNIRDLFTTFEPENTETTGFEPQAEVASVVEEDKSSEAQKVIGQEEVKIDANEKTLEQEQVIENEPITNYEDKNDFDWTGFFNTLDQNVAEQQIIENEEDAKGLKKVG